MEIFLMALNTVVPIFIMMMAGYVLSKANIITDEMCVDLSKIYNMLLLPASLLVSAYSSNVRENVAVKLIAFGLAGVIFCVIVGRILFPPKEGNKQQFAWNHAIYRGNIALVGLAVTERMYPDGDLSNMVLFIAITVIMVSAISEVQISRYGGKPKSGMEIVKTLLKSPVMMASVLGLLLSVIGLRIPDMLLSSFSTIGKAATPIGFIALGASLKLREARKYITKLSIFIVLKQIVFPLIMVAIGCGLLGFRGIDTAFIIALLGCPPAVVTFAVAKANQDKVDSDLAGQLVAFSTLMSVFTMMILIIIVSKFGLL